jgi:mono/diheme cytochrome c family protein
MRNVLFVLMAAAAAVSLAAYATEPRKPGSLPDVQSVASPMEMSDASVRQGQQVYTRMCVTCHGLDGKGNTDMGETLEAPPSDLTNGEWNYGGTDGELLSVIQRGTETGMPAFSEKLNEQRMWQVIHYLRTIGPEPGIDAPEMEDVPENPIEYSVQSAGLGKRLYQRSCLKCHGVYGKGDTEMREFLPTHPSDLTNDQWTYGGRDGDIFLVIKNGTEYDMPGFAEELSDERIWHIVNYLRSLGPEKP